MMIQDFGRALGTSKLLDARRRGAPTRRINNTPQVLRLRSIRPELMAEGRIVSLSNERSDRPSSVAGYCGGWKGNTTLRLTQGHEPVEWQMTA
jgi:hypothetical protein